MRNPNVGRDVGIAPYVISCSKLSNSGVLKNSPNVIPESIAKFFYRCDAGIFTFTVEYTF